jgi:hypothetical protein
MLAYIISVVAAIVSAAIIVKVCECLGEWNDLQ